MTNQPVADAEQTRRTRFGRLPEHVALEDTIATQDPDPAPDPSMGRDPERDFILRNAGG
jgi:hypothetical protein